MRFNGFNNTDDDDKSRDFFDGPDIDREEKKPVYKPDDPMYYEEDESRWEHLRPRRGIRFWIYLLGAAVLAALLVGCYMRYFTPYITDATEYGYVESIDRRGSAFKTYEGVLLPYKSLMDTTRVYDHNFIFTAEGEQVATALREAMLQARPVRVVYKQYHATVPWRGEAQIVVVGVSNADPAKILPPDRTPDYYRKGTYRSDDREKKAIKEREDAAEE